MEECKVAAQLSCPGCKTKLEQAGSDDAIVTCLNCGTSQNPVTGRRLTIKASVIPSKKGQEDIPRIIRDWMGAEFHEVRDLATGSTLLDPRLFYLPFFIIDLKANSRYEGRSTENGEEISKNGLLERGYNWKILGTRTYDFPTLKYNIPLDERTVIASSTVCKGAIFYNSQMDEEDARSATKGEIDEYFKDKLSSDLEVITRLETTLDIKEVYLVYSCIWESWYEYGGCRYRILIDGSSGTVIQGDTPTKDVSSDNGFFERLRKSFFG
ncbi:MAG: hypothetical protein SVM80_13595 [Halobacteriota archaeon]|nr:hypothetical protein [Halobacteriota archaeon]